MDCKFMPVSVNVVLDCGDGCEKWSVVCRSVEVVAVGL